jgi:threonylcarbamoyladenosine tRNA methylthiotransferase MtaB
MLTSLIHSMPLPTAIGVKQTTVTFRTLGCKLNQCETAQMQEMLTASGYVLVGWDRPADVRVINTCTVTAKSDRTCRREIRLAKRLDPGCLVAVTGCYAQVDPQAVAAIPGVDLVLGNVEKTALAQYLAGAAGGGAPFASVSSYPEHPSFEQEFISHFYGYTRAFLKIQTGCDARCAYCIIPLARGPARSMPATQVARQVQLLRSRDYKEVVLTGINLGSWGRDTGEGRLADLLASLTADDGTLRSLRYRLSSIEPLGVDAELLDAIDKAGEGAAHHFHLPLQSGSASVLERMNRPYKPEEYLRVVDAVAARFPEAALGADLIAGFPGETEVEFEETLDFVDRSPLTYVHVFSYSDRQGTAALAMTPKVHPDVIHERSLRLRTLGERKAVEFRRTLRGSEQKALVLRERSGDGRLVGLTGNYMEVLLTGEDSLTNKFVRVVLEEERPDGRWEAASLAIEEDADAREDSSITGEMA